jgi:hypothetical protein
MRAAAARSASLPCCTATWLFAGPLLVNATATDVRSGQVIRMDFPRVAARTVSFTPGSQRARLRASWKAR